MIEDQNKQSIEKLQIWFFAFAVIVTLFFWISLASYSGKVAEFKQKLDIHTGEVNAKIEEVERNSRFAEVNDTERRVRALYRHLGLDYAQEGDHVYKREKRPWE